MNLSTKFELQQRVLIKELGLRGTVKSIMTSDAGLQYEVRYFVENKPTTIWFFESELRVSKVEAHKALGFGGQAEA